MVRAHFNIRLDDAVLPDRVGQCVADRDGARALARTIVRSLVLRHGGEPRLLDAVMVVTDADGAPLLDMSFFEALYLPVEPVADLSRARTTRSVPLLSDARLAAALAPVRRLAGAVSARVQPLLGN